MIRNIFITGAPSSGKTTVIKKLISGCEFPMKGFYTEEEREGEKRVGFRMTTLGGKSGYLAHRDIDSGYRIRRYGVSIENIETPAVPSIEPEEGHIIILDEIGKMECFSEMFRIRARRVLDSPNIVIGSITLGGFEFIRSIKERDDVSITEITPENRDGIPQKIMESINKLL